MAYCRVMMPNEGKGRPRKTAFAVVLRLRFRSLQ